MEWAKYMEEAKRRLEAATTFAGVEAGSFECAVARGAAYLEKPYTIATVETMEAACARLRAQIESEAG